MSDPQDISQNLPSSDKPPSEENWIDDIVPEAQESSSRPRYVRKVDPASPIVMVETAFLASAASLIYLVNSYFPMGPLLQIFFPIPIALVYQRWGNRAAWMAALVSGLLLSVLIGPSRSIQFIVPFGLLGVLLGTLWYRRARWAVSIPIASLLNVAGAFFRIWLLSVLTGEDLWLYGSNQIINLLEWVFLKLGLLIQPSLVLVQLVVFAMIIANSIIYLFVVHVVAWFLFDRLNNPIPNPPNWVQVLLDSE
ncbi:DUF2232 domain-containing protein [Phormidesmis priestleyi]